VKTVVTGGAGFIGSHLTKRLLEMGREVVVADDFSRGRLQNLRDLGVGSDTAPVDLRDYGQARAVVEGAESVFHLAARVGSVEFLHGSDLAELLALQANLVIDINVFRACLESGVERLVYASSVSVYPIDRQQSYGVVLKEEDLRYINPEGGYGWAKLLGEVQLKWMKDMKVGIARIFNVYSEGEDPTGVPHVIPDLMRKAVLYPDVEFQVWGDGQQTRDFLYVADCVEALLKLEEKASWPPVVVNIGSGHALSIETVAKKIVELSGKSIQAIYETAKPVGPLSRTADVSKARVVLGWEPRVDLDEGLRRTLRWVERRLQLSSPWKA
jgi:nucleoside-diphosphate-sugar epimerase